MTLTPLARWTDQDTLTSVSAGICEVMTERIASAGRYGTAYEHLWRTAADRAHGGKLMRPWLVGVAYDAYCGGRGSSSSMVSLAVAVELLHFAFVLHDDVIDDDVVRRGKDNVIGTLAQTRSTYSQDVPATPSLHWGTTGAILVGDALLAHVYKTFADAVVRGGEDPRLLDLLHRATNETIAGEWQDVSLAHRVTEPTLSAILDMAANKTATYSVELPLQVGATLAGASIEEVETLSSVGRSLGLAFQLHDDLVTAFGDPAIHGKDPLSDLREGKDTPLIAFARLTSAWKVIEPHWANPHVSIGDWALVKEALEQCGARSFVEGLIDECVTAVRGTLAESTVPAHLATSLDDVCRRLQEARA